jgi:SAM-dependent methyltransferase
MSLMPNINAYDVDLAYIHDAGFGDFAENAAPSLLRIVSQFSDLSKLIVDLGCGSGIWARMLANSGYKVIGVDISAEMIELARQRVPEATFHVGSFADFTIPACRSVTALGEVFNYLFDPNNSLPTLRRVCQNVFDALLPNGAFIFDVAEPGRCSGLKKSFWEGEDWACLVEYLHDEPTEQLTRRIVTFRKVGGAYRRHQETHRQQLYDRTAVAEMLRSIGYQVEIVPGYGRLPFPTGLVGFVARKA